MYSIRSIDVISRAKIMAAVHGCLSLLFVPILVLAGLVSILVGPSSDKLPVIAAIGVGVLFAIVLPLFYAAIGFLIGALGAWVYNMVAMRIGGIKIELVVPASTQALTSAPIPAI